MIPRDHQWLVDVAAAAGHLDPSDAPVLRHSTIEDAWSTVCGAAKLSPAELAELVAERFGLPVANLSDVDPGTAALLPPRLVQSHVLRALRQGPRGIEVATANPADPDVLHLLHFVIDVPIQLSVAPPGDLLMQPASEAAPGPSAPRHAGVLDLDLPVLGESTIIRLGHQMLRQAVERRASDVHIQPHSTGGAIRMRIDGVLRRVASLPRSTMLRLVSRLKLLAEMDPTDHLRPQDGRLQLRCNGRTHDLRLSSVPVQGAEKLVLRLLGAHSNRSLRDVGVGRPELDQLSALLSRGQGLVLVTGPTGSGKTTTLYGALADRNEPGVNIATVEDPVEIRLPWLTQIEVNPKADLTFANALRSVLRQDPDIVLIGEIRDPETAQIAVQAALTGHLVLATLHTNDAVTAIPRLLDLGVSRQLLGQALAGASAQRLLRRLCPDCAQPAEAPGRDGQWLIEHAGVTRLWEPLGCPACGHTGYRGRLPITQVFEFTPEMSVAIEAAQPLGHIRDLATRGGLRTLAESALDRLVAGETTLSEVLRILGSDFWLDLGRALQRPPWRKDWTPRHDEDEHDAQILVISHDAALLRQTAQAIVGSGYVAIEAADSRSGRAALERSGAVTAIVMDLRGLMPERVRTLLEVRETLGGAAIPILGLREQGDSPITSVLADQPGVIMRRRPEDAPSLSALLREAIARLD